MNGLISERLINSILLRHNELRKTARFFNYLGLDFGKMPYAMEGFVSFLSDWSLKYYFLALPQLMGSDVVKQKFTTQLSNFH